MNILPQERLDSLIKLWELLLSKSAEKGRMLLFTQKRVHFLHETEEVMSWILEKVSHDKTFIYFKCSLQTSPQQQYSIPASATENISIFSLSLCMLM